MPVFECGKEVVEVILQSEFFLVDVEFLDVENHFLLKTVMVEFNRFEFGERVLDSSFYFSNAFCLVLLHLIEQLLNASNFFFEERVQTIAFLCAEFHQRSNGVGKHARYGGNLLFRCFCGERIGLYGIGQPQKRGIPIGGQWQV